MFHQCEGLWIGENVSFKDLKAVFTDFCRTFFESDDLQLRFGRRSSRSPSRRAEIDIAFGSGPLKGQWLEVSGAGQVHPTVMRNFGLDPERYIGFAFGMGLGSAGDAALRHRRPAAVLRRRPALPVAVQVRRKRRDAIPRVAGCASSAIRRCRTTQLRRAADDVGHGGRGACARWRRRSQASWSARSSSAEQHPERRQAAQCAASMAGSAFARRRAAGGVRRAQRARRACACRWHWWAPCLPPAATAASALDIQVGSSCAASRATACCARHASWSCATTTAVCSGWPTMLPPGADMRQAAGARRHAVSRSKLTPNLGALPVGVRRGARSRRADRCAAAHACHRCRWPLTSQRQLPVRSRGH